MVGLLELLLLLLVLVLMLVLIGGVRSFSVGCLPGEGHRSSIFLYYDQCSLLCRYIDRSRRPIPWWQVEGVGGGTVRFGLRRVFQIRAGV